MFQFLLLFLPLISTIVVEDETTLKSLNPTFAERKTAKLRLDNGLEVYLISDPQADQSGAALTVTTGHWDNPEQYPGTAHFLEHMLFLGTKEFPEESGYRQYISSYGGEANAFTTNDATSYLFSIADDGYDEALQRFSSFFKEPLFNPSGVNRELHAIEQEFGTRLDNDMSRLFHVMKEQVNPAHPDHLFHIGNLKSLAGVSQATLKSWYRENYSADKMHLILLSKRPLTELQGFAESLFGPIPKQPTTVREKDIPLFVNQDPYWVEIAPVQEVQKLFLIWEMPDQLAKRRDAQPDTLISYVMGHEGKESLLATLKAEGLAEALGSGALYLSEEKGLFTIQVDLTDRGVKEKERVVVTIFATLARLREKSYPQYLFDEVQQVQKLSYIFQSRQNTYQILSELISQITYENLSTFPECTRVIQTFDPQLVEELLSALTPLTAQYYLLIPPEEMGAAPNRQEKWTETDYRIAPISPQLLKEWATVQPLSSITLPPPNPFIPTIASAVSSSEQPQFTWPHPEPLVDDDRGHLFVAKDHFYLLPKLSCTFTIKSPQFQPGNAKKVALTDLWIKCLEEQLMELKYLAYLGGLQLNMKRGEEGIFITVDGYADKAPLFLTKLFQEIASFRITEEQFYRIYATQKREYTNALKEQPVYQAFELFNKALRKQATTAQERLNALHTIDWKTFKTFPKKFLKQTYVEALFYGALDTTQVQTIWDSWNTSIASQGYPEGKKKLSTLLSLPADNGPFLIEAETPAQGNAALLSVEYPTFSFRDRAAQQILDQAMQEPFFTTLRTEQQTGYIVQSFSKEVDKQLFLLFATQSTSHDPRDLISRFELFIESYLRALPTEEQFQSIKGSLLEKLLRPPHSIQDMAAVLNLLVFTYNDFDWMTKRIEGLQELTYSDISPFAHTFLSKSNPRRLGILLRGYLPKNHILHYHLTTPKALHKKLT
ncbi:MAG: insulinase family protein [Chlamydiia bacterium]|nr:insulinase family protein [Chlamydiia bacterium]